MANFFDKQAKLHNVQLNKVQKKAVTHAAGPMLLLACPGSGKTTTLIMRIGYLIEELKIPANRIKAITFSRAAANDMKSRFRQFFPELGPVDFSTIHSLAYSITARYLKSKSVSFTLIEGNSDHKVPSKSQILKDAYKRIVKMECTDDQLQEIMQYISFIKNNRVPHIEWGEIEMPNPQAQAIAIQYESVKAKNPNHLLLDFDDLLVIAHDALSLDKRMHDLFSGAYDFVLTDESQDTSRLQHAIVEQLVSVHQNLCVVADDDQTIYSWRAADPTFLLKFKETYPSAKIYKMEQNYRSSKNIVSVANQFIKRNKKRYNKEMFTENSELNEILLKQLHDDSAQMRYVIYELLNLKDTGDAAILFRNNSSAILYISELERRGIPFYMKDADQRFFSHWVVEDILNFMRLSFNQERKDVFLKIARKFNLYLSNDQIKRFEQIEKTGNVFELLSRYIDLKDYQIKAIISYQKTYNKMKDARPKTVIQLIREELGYEQLLQNRSDKYGFHFDSLLEIMRTLEQIAEPYTTMEAFAARLAELDVIMQKSKKTKDPRAVTLSTLHSSKGLEFSHVYMIDCLSGIIPSEEDMQDPDKLEEARRLFYVGMTRAKHHLEILTYSTKDGKEKRESRFVSEVRSLLLNRKQGLQRETKDKRIEETEHPDTIKEKNRLSEGLAVVHKKFGEGFIQTLSADRIILRFGKEQKELSIQMVIDKGLLQESKKVGGKHE